MLKFCFLLHFVAREKAAEAERLQKEEQERLAKEAEKKRRIKEVERLAKELEEGRIQLRQENDR